jgi:hypothetical protein
MGTMPSSNTIPPTTGFFGGQITNPTISPVAIKTPYIGPWATQSGTIPPQPIIPPSVPISTLQTTPANILAPTYSALKAPSGVNPFTSGIGTGVTTSVVYGSNPSLFHPTTAASQVSMTLPAHNAVAGAVGPIAPSSGVGGPVVLSSANLGGTVNVIGASAGAISNPSVTSAPPASTTIDPTTVAAAAVGGAALLLFLL